MATITAVQESFGLELSPHLSEIMKDIIVELNKIDKKFITDIKVFEGVEGKIIILRCIIPADATVSDAMEEHEDGSGSGHEPIVGCAVVITKDSLSCNVIFDEFEEAIRAAADKHGEKDCHAEQEVHG